MVKASAESSWPISRAAAAFACSIGAPDIEPERSMTTASESGGRRPASPRGAVIETATYCSSCAARIWLEVNFAVSARPSSLAGIVPLVGPCGARLAKSSAAITVAPAAPRTKEVRTRCATFGVIVRRTPEIGFRSKNMNRLRAEI